MKKHLSKADRFGMTYAILIVIIFIWILFFEAYTSIIMPLLDYVGVVEYEKKSKITLKYERFLQSVNDCHEKKNIYSEKSSKCPVLHVFVCPRRGEVIWKYKVKVNNDPRNKKVLLE